MDSEDLEVKEILRMHEKLANWIVSQGDYIKPGEQNYPKEIEPRAL